MDLNTAGLIATTEQRMVLGLGVTGCSVARWWRRQGVPFMAADTRAEMATHDEVLEAVGPDAPLYCGDVDPALLASVSELVVSPGIAIDAPLLRAARDAGVRIIGDIDLFMGAVDVPVIGITGSNGKTTVTSLLGQMLAGAGAKVAVGGNLGTPALDLIDDAVELYILELSSFQLERAETLGLSVATVLNVSADHLDRHGSMPRYHQAKHRIFAGAKAVVANRADPLTIPLLESPVDVVLWRPDEPDLKEFGTRMIDGEPWLCRGFEPLLAVSALRLQGQHNVSNALVALACGSAAGFEVTAMLDGLRNFRGLPHRCEVVVEHAGVRWINDSKGTNVGATVAALEGLGREGNIILIAGGVGKDQDFSALAPTASRYCKRILTMGDAAREIEVALGAKVPCQRVADLSTAVARAAELAKPGDTVLLSPACASFDMFHSYEDRGDQFRHSVLAQVEVAQ